MNIENAFERLGRSKFRSRFYLSEKDKKYISDKGMDTIRSHTYDFIRKRLAPSDIPNDGKQTPMRGHPAFIAQHACACCCRGCLEKWHHIPAGRRLSDAEQNEIADLLMAWIEKEFRGI